MVCRPRAWLIIVVLFPTFLLGGRLNGYFSSHTDTFSRHTREDSSLMHMRLYQSDWLQGSDLLLKNSRLNLSCVFYSDPVNSFDNEPIFQIYSFNYSTAWFSKKLIINLGRQFQYSVSDADRMDGITTNYKYLEYTVKGFIGSYVPASEITDNPIGNHFLGGEISWHRNKTMDIRIGYSDKAHSKPVYSSAKLNRDIEVPASIKRRIGLQGRLHRKNLTFFTRSRHQIKNFELTDFTFQTEYKGNKN